MIIILYYQETIVQMYNGFQTSLHNSNKWISFLIWWDIIMDMNIRFHLWGRKRIRWATAFFAQSIPFMYTCVYTFTSWAAKKY